MAAATEPRKTKRQLSPFDWYIERDAAGVLYHGTLVGLNASGKVAEPGAGVRPLGRVSVPDQISSVADERVRIDFGIFLWEDAGVPAATVADELNIAYAVDNQSVSNDTADGVELGIIVEFSSEGLWVLSGPGVGNLYAEET